MPFLPRRLDLHVFYVVAVGNLLCLVVTVVSMELLLLAFVASDVFYGTGATIEHHLLATAYQIPRLTIDCLPTVATTGAAFAYSHMSRRNELPIFRSAGVSAWRFLAPGAVHGLLVGGFVVLCFWQISAAADYRSGDIIDRLTGRKHSNEVTVWLHQRDGPQTVLVRGTKLTPFSDSLDRTSFFVLRQEEYGPTFDRRIDGRAASLSDGKWRIDSAITRYSSGETRLSDEIDLPTNLTTPVLHALGISESHISFFDYPRYIESRKIAGRATEKYSYRFHFLLALPILLAGTTMMGGLLCARMARSGRLPMMMALSVGYGVFALFMTSIAYAVAVRNLIDPVVAAWCPSLFFFFLALAAIAFTEDG